MEKLVQDRSLSHRRDHSGPDAGAITPQDRLQLIGRTNPPKVRMITEGESPNGPRANKRESASYLE